MRARGVVLAVLSVMLGCATISQATTYYLGPVAPASNSNNGLTPVTPWATFAYALPRLAPDDILILLNGIYTGATHSTPQFTCNPSNTAVPIHTQNGTPGHPITVRAQEERGAHFQSNGGLIPLRIQQCAYWIIEGLRFSVADNPSNTNLSGAAVEIKGGDHLTLRRLLIYSSNRYFAGSGIEILEGSHDILAEENEIYFQIRNAFTIKNSSNNTIRRNYGHSRSADDIPGGRITGDPGRGDAGISCYPCANNIFENNIMEAWGNGFDIAAAGTTVNNRYYGNIALDNGFNVMGARSASLAEMPRDTYMQDFVSVRSGGGKNNAYGMGWRSNKNSRCVNCSFLDGVSGARGLVADNGGTGDGLPTVYGTNILVVNNAGGPFSITSQLAWNMNYVLAYGNGAGATPPLTDSHYTNVVSTTQSVNPQLGSCKVYIPVGSPAKGAGLGGADIGANVVYRYQNGVLQDGQSGRPGPTTLWDPVTSRFPCGRQIANVNDQAGLSCFDVHQRLNVNANGCSVPLTNEPPAHTPTTYYIDDTGGSDGDDGLSPANAWATFAHAVTQLLPGDTLIVQDGIYTGTNMLQANCAAGASSGTVDQPITIQAATRRAAWLQSDGATDPVHLTQCAYWTLDGLVATHADAGSLAAENVGTVIRLSGGDHLTLRHLLVAQPKRTVAIDAILSIGTDFVTIEDTEVYQFHRNGLQFNGAGGQSTQGHVVRRVYLHSKAYADAGAATTDTTRGDIGIRCFSCVNTLMENVVVEDVAQGIVYQVVEPSQANRLKGSIVRGSATGIAVLSGATGGETGINQMVRDLTIENISVSGATVAGLHLESVKNLTCTQCSILDGTGVGVLVDESLTAIGDNAPTFTLASPLIAGMTGYGYNVDTTQYTTWAIINAWLYANTGGYTPAVSHANITGAHLTDPARQTCLVWVPQSSPAWQGGPNQSHIGAQIIHQWHEGAEITTLLWDPVTNQFPCGVQVAGINGAGDGERCMTVHERLNVETNGCTLAGEVEPPSPPMTYQRRQWRTLPTLAMPW